MRKQLYFSVVVPVHNRPQEVGELLDSLAVQTEKNFEVLIVEDGSSIPCGEQVEKRKKILDVHYFYKEKSGPGLTRNYGCKRAKGNYCILLDSDCILPPHYFETLNAALHRHYTDAFGGPDRAREDFSPFQKAVSHSMTSFFTTGGIRGGAKRLDKFHPKSFNMGYSKEVFEATNGFSAMPIGEDTDMSIRIIKSGFTTQLLKDVFVFHKRRTNLKKFIKQVYIFGAGRAILSGLYPETLKWVYTMPALFTLGVVVLLALSITVSAYFLLPIGLCMLLFCVDATLKTKNIGIGILSIATSFVQLVGYGIGFVDGMLRRSVQRKP